MSTASSQAYLNTRVSAMATRLLGREAIARMARMTLPELGERYGLAALQEDVLGPRAQGRALEQTLIQVLLAELTILVRPMSAPERDILVAWGRKYALLNLKTLIRGKLYNLDPQDIRDNLFELPPIVRLHDQDLLRAENVLELLRQLEAGPLRPIARQAREIYEQRREPFALEAAIDQHYYTGLVRQLVQLQDGNREPLRRLLGAELDRVALLWLLRFRFSYGLSPSETFYRLVPSMHLLHRERLLRLVNLERFERVLESLPRPLDLLLAESASIVEVQRRLGRYFVREACRILHLSPSGVARALAYLMLRETDLLRLYALVQGRLLGLSTEAVEIALEIAEPSCPWAGSGAAG